MDWQSALPLSHASTLMPQNGFLPLHSEYININPGQGKYSVGQILLLLFFFFNLILVPRLCAGTKFKFLTQSREESLDTMDALCYPLQ